MDDASTLDSLALAAASGDAEAFRRIVLTTQYELRLHIAARCHDAELVEEIVHGAYVEAWETLPAYQARGLFVAWLKSIGRHLLLREQRRRYRQPATDPGDLGELLADERSNAHDDDAADAVAQRLRDCLAHLPAQAQTLLHRRYADGLDINQLAMAYKRKRDALIALLYRLRNQLRACLESKGLRT